VGRSLGDIIEECQSGGRPDYDDMRYAICALQSLATMDFSDQRRILEAKRPEIAALRSEECFQRRKRAYAAPPKKWLGPEYDPDSAEVQRRREISQKVFEKVVDGFDDE